MDDYRALVDEAREWGQREAEELGEDSYSARTLTELADAVESQRSRIAALEAVIEKAHSVGDRDEWPHDLLVSVLEILGSAPSTVLDQMIREAKAEAWDEGWMAWVRADLRPNPYQDGDV